jgi:glycerophosphoryl diester phosphodiesterase
MLIYGHRGSPAAIAENTLPSFEAAIQAGVAGLEFDVRASADGVLVVIHDRDLKRTTSGAGNVDELSFDTVREADAGNGASIPTMDEVLELAGDRVHLDIEVKQAGIESKILDTLARFPKSRWVLSSFDPEILKAFRSRSGSADLVPISPFATPELVTFAKNMKSPAVALLASAYDETSAELFASENLPVIVWTVNDVAEARRVQSLGAYGLCTDCPADTIAGLRRDAEV